MNGWMLDVAIVLFVLLESANVFILYFLPHSKMGNGVAVFDAYARAKNDEGTRLFANYMKNWVAGSKLIFIALLIVILFLGSDILKLFALLAMMLSITSFYFGLYPIIKTMDERGELSPKGYAKTLFYMISAFLLLFLIVLLLYFMV